MCRPPISYISVGDVAADKILQSDLIVWDEAANMDVKYITTVDHKIREIVAQDGKMHLAQAPFGGKVILLIGDFR